MTAVTLRAEAVLQAAIMMSISIKMSLMSPEAVWIIKTFTSLTVSSMETLVSRFENLRQVDFPTAIPRFLQIISVKRGWELPENTASGDRIRVFLKRPSAPWQPGSKFLGR